GGMPLSVLTGSMRPTYPPGTLVVIKPAAPEEIGIGDVITFQIESGKPAVATHRVIARSTDSGTGEVRFTTQGDANTAPDPVQVQPAQIRGKVWYAIPYLGWVNQAIGGQTRSWAVPALAGALFLYALWNVGSGLRERGRGKRVTAEELPSDAGSDWAGPDRLVRAVPQREGANRRHRRPAPFPCAPPTWQGVPRRSIVVNVAVRTHPSGARPHHRSCDDDPARERARRHPPAPHPDARGLGEPGRPVGLRARRR